MMQQIMNPPVEKASQEQPLVGAGRMAMECFQAISSISPHRKGDFNIKKMGSSAESTNSDSSSIVKNYIRNIATESVEVNEKTLEDFITSEQAIQSTFKQILKSNYFKLLKEYHGSDKKFTDDSFPPCAKSLGGRWLNQKV
jgi:ABC-type transporter MlaC component